MAVAIWSLAFRFSRFDVGCRPWAKQRAAHQCWLPSRRRRIRMLHVSATAFCIGATVVVGDRDGAEVGAELVLSVGACVGVGDDASEARAEKLKPHQCRGR